MVRLAQLALMGSLALASCSHISQNIQPKSLTLEIPKMPSPQKLLPIETTNIDKNKKPEEPTELKKTYDPNKDNSYIHTAILIYDRAIQRASEKTEPIEILVIYSITQGSIEEVLEDKLTAFKKKYEISESNTFDEYKEGECNAERIKLLHYIKILPTLRKWFETQLEEEHPNLLSNKHYQNDKNHYTQSLHSKRGEKLYSELDNYLMCILPTQH